MDGLNICSVRWLTAIDEVDPKQWDRLALPMRTPLLEWQWLKDLEASGSISPRHGWQPKHLTLWAGPDLVGAAPLYIKTHSEGEFIFDHWWAKLAGEVGIDYYPKLVGMSPATPSVGYRFLMAADTDQAALLQGMLAAIDRFCENRHLSCFHMNFIDPAWSVNWSDQGFIGWRHQSYLWQNLNYRTFDDYLTMFKSSQRRNIRRERRRMQASGIHIETHRGDAIRADLGSLMYRYYLRTNAQYGPWAARYLNGDFFDRLFRNYRHRLLIVSARRPPSRHPIALSMLLVKGQHLIGRYWGCEAPVKDLHFNMCFYAPIQWAIENKIRTFDPGVGSSHKIYRGFRAVANTSLHRFYDDRLGFLFRQLIGDVNRMEQSVIDGLNSKLPFAERPD